MYGSISPKLAVAMHLEPLAPISPSLDGKVFRVAQTQAELIIINIYLTVAFKKCTSGAPFKEQRNRGMQDIL